MIESRSRNRIFGTALLALLALGSALHAETRITLHPPGDAAYEAMRQDARNSQGRSTFGDRANLPTNFYILPAFKVDADDAAGETTLFAVRAEGLTDIQVRYYPPDSFTPDFVENASLPVHEVFTRNVRDILEPMDTGIVSGYIEIEANGPITADYFQVIPDQDFATGGIPFDLGNDELCDRWRARFLIGGGFSGGTLLTLLINGPHGMGQPSVVGSAFSEAGAEINTFNIESDQVSAIIPAADLVLPGNNFGSFTLEFVSEFGGGAVFVNHDATGRYSVGLPGHCLGDAPLLLE